MQTGDMGKDDQMNQAMVVFLHGAASSVKTWHPTMAALPSQRMIALPLLGTRTSLDGRTIRWWPFAIMS